ncbi:hypothetical protein QCE81_38990 [Caballeronia sp. LZ002]|uniref:hypothetical protein n=2 Tax=unclassified Caballeronia TaxID=2646786 RepID=UPI00285A29F0|nr:hypothetical protein [Caballeronia sp. LZ002]MDR5777762.1 hypothetical protein [Caballeronia sp. LZ002]MDR5853197.1 hypothetical protein [Caballeronia sp. LZ003]
MFTPEGADDAEIILRPAANGRWKVEVPTGQAVVVTVVNNEREAIALAHAIRPDAGIRFLPAVE